MAYPQNRPLALHSAPALDYDEAAIVHQVKILVKTAVRSQMFPKKLALLLVVCCLAPLAASAAVLYLVAPVWLVAPVGLLALVLLARRVMALLDAPDTPAAPYDGASAQGAGNRKSPSA